MVPAMSAFGKWAKGQSSTDIDEDELDDELEGDEEEDEEEDLDDGPDPEAIAARLWAGELGEEEIASMDGELLGTVVDASAESEPELHAAVLGLAQGVADQDMAGFTEAYRSLLDAELHGEGPEFTADQCVALVGDVLERVEKGTKLDTPDGKKLLAKLISFARSDAEMEPDDEEDELADDEAGDDEAADAAILDEFDA